MLRLFVARPRRDRTALLGLRVISLLGLRAISNGALRAHQPLSRTRRVSGATVRRAYRLQHTRCKSACYHVRAIIKFPRAPSQRDCADSHASSEAKGAVGLGGGVQPERQRLLLLAPQDEPRAMGKPHITTVAVAGVVDWAEPTTTTTGTASVSVWDPPPHTTWLSGTNSLPPPAPRSRSASSLTASDSSQPLTGRSSSIYE